jgi:hypothetical protein
MITSMPVAVATRSTMICELRGADPVPITFVEVVEVVVIRDRSIERVEVLTALSKRHKQCKA